MSNSDILVVISKLKKYVREKASMNTSASAASALSDIVKGLCDQAIENARKDRRKTVKDRDFSASE